MNWLRKQPNWTKVIRLGATRFATTLFLLKSLHDHKDYLQSLVVSSHFKKILNVQKGREVKQIILDENFWRNCLIVVKIMGPLICLLWICNSNEKPTMGYGMMEYTGLVKVLKNCSKERSTCTSLILPLLRSGGVGLYVNGFIS